jgi:hypothetical protein
MMENTNSEGGSFVMALAGNKCDLDPSLVKIPLETAADLAKKHNMILAETSSENWKRGLGIIQKNSRKNCYQQIVSRCIKLIIRLLKCK